MLEKSKTILWLIFASLGFFIFVIGFFLIKSIDFLLVLLLSILLKIQSSLFVFSKIRKDTKITMKNIMQKQEGNKFYIFYKYLFMPTRLYSEIIKEKSPHKFLIYMKKMTCFSLIASVVIALSMAFISYISGWNNIFDFLSIYDNNFINFVSKSLTYFICLWCVSRIIEITYAFIHDARTHLAPSDKLNSIPYFERVHLAMVSYIELIILFGILYFCLNSLHCAFNIDISIIDAIYFSGVTITTLGYGDIQPTFWVTKILTVTEVLCGFTLIIVSFTVYVSRAINNLNE